MVEIAQIPALTTAGREVDCSDGVTVRRAVWSILRATVVLMGESVASQPAIADGFCTPQGCYIWASYFASTFGGGSGGGGGSTNCTADCGGPYQPPPPPQAIPPSQLPSLSKLLCAESKYGARAPRHYAVVITNIYAFASVSTDQEVFSETTPYAPPGYIPVYGDTVFDGQIYGGGDSVIYAGGLRANGRDVTYIAPGSTLPATLHGPFTGFEWGLITVAHEVAHQNGVEDEEEAEGYGAIALQDYRTDHGAKCP